MTTATIDLADKLAPYPSLVAIVGAVIAVWPEHEKYCRTRFANDTPDFLTRSEDLARLALLGMGDDLPRFAADYRWTSERFVEEEFFFLREGRYRLSTFAEAQRKVYDNPDFMPRYVRCILISQLIWDPHARAIDLFRTRFLPGIAAGTNYLEVGPGHGFFLYFASQQTNVARLEAWDVSASSIAETQRALATLGVTREIAIVHQDVLEAPARSGEFDAAVISEVIEHLERPDLALRSLYAALKPGGRIFINVPINSPAPDHIYLWESPEEMTAFVEAQGFVIDEAHFLPQTGCSLERALKLKVNISCVYIAHKPA